jgi:hypothetical protein
MPIDASREFTTWMNSPRLFTPLPTPSQGRYDHEAFLQRFKCDFALEGSCVSVANTFHLWTSYVESNNIFHLSKLSSVRGTAHPCIEVRCL